MLNGPPVNLEGLLPVDPCSGATCPVEMVDTTPGTASLLGPGLEVIREVTRLSEGTAGLRSGRRWGSRAGCRVCTACVRDLEGLSASSLLCFELSWLCSVFYDEDTVSTCSGDIVSQLALTWTRVRKQA